MGTLLAKECTSELHIKETVDDISVLGKMEHEKDEMTTS